MLPDSANEKNRTDATLHRAASSAQTAGIQFEPDSFSFGQRDEPMNAIVIEHVKVSELPKAWREKLSADINTRVTVRIEAETGPVEKDAVEPFVTDDPAFGIWRDREDMVDVEAYVRKLRAPRYTRD